ncbi:MAG: preprotein translocase subunit SecE [Bryobacterales bacterium]|nr:preprotein translocase subunit SecE [Bryobacterales bacterium]
MATETSALPQNGGSLSKVSGWPAAIKDYIHELQAEMRRVTWPSPKQVRATTGVVIAAVFLFAAYFAAVDFLLGRAVNQLFHTLARR